MAGPWEAFQSGSSEPVAANGPWSAFANKPASDAPLKITVAPNQTTTAPEAFGRGVLGGATFNFMDELSGLVRAGGIDPDTADPNNPDVAKALGALVLGSYRKLKGDPEAQRLYQEEVTKQRTTDKAAETEHPIASTTGNIAGAVAVPIGAAGRGATLGGRMARGAAVGGPLGALSGFGAGEGLEGSLKGAAIGGLAGFGLGAVAPPLVEGAVQLGRAVTQPIVNMARAAFNPQKSADRAIGNAYKEAVRADPGAVNRLTPSEVGTGASTVMDVLGQPGKNLARSAGNLSGEARDTLNQTLEPRFEDQVPRLVGWLRQTFGSPNAHAQQEAIDKASRTANRGAYARAEHEAAKSHPGGLWDEGFDQISQAPVVQDAIRKASITGSNRAARDGFTPIGNPFNLDRDTGRMVLRDGVSPNLGFWDEVKKNLDKVGTREAKDFAKVLREHVDQYVPAYRSARQGAAAFFGAENALEAGQKFVTENFARDGTRAALAKMSPVERKLFEEGFVSRYMEILEKVPDRADVVRRIYNSPEAREKFSIALGHQRAQEFEAILRVENIMQQSQRAVSGNSSTVAQSVGIGLAGAGGSTALGYDPSTSGIAGLVAALTTAGKRGLDQRVATRIAQMLTSDDPEVIRRGVQIVARNQGFMEALRSGDMAAVRGGAQQGANIPALQAAGVGRAEDDQPAVPRPPGQ